MLTVQEINKELVARIRKIDAEWDENPERDLGRLSRELWHFLNWIDERTDPEGKAQE